MYTLDDIKKIDSEVADTITAEFERKLGKSRSNVCYGVYFDK